MISVQHLAPVLEAVSTAGTDQTDQNVSNHFISGTLLVYH